jgi:hypothetical protein
VLDVYGFGVVLQELTTGKRIYRVKTKDYRQGNLYHE